MRWKIARSVQKLTSLIGPEKGNGAFNSDAKRCMPNPWMQKRNPRWPVAVSSHNLTLVFVQMALQSILNKDRKQLQQLRTLTNNQKRFRPAAFHTKLDPQEQDKQRPSTCHSLRSTKGAQFMPRPFTSAGLSTNRWPIFATYFFSLVRSFV